MDQNQELKNVFFEFVLTNIKNIFTKFIRK